MCIIHKHFTRILKFIAHKADPSRITELIYLSFITRQSVNSLHFIDQSNYVIYYLYITFNKNDLSNQ